MKFVLLIMCFQTMQLRNVSKLNLGCHEFLFQLHNTLLLEDELRPVYLFVGFNMASVIPDFGI